MNEFSSVVYTLACSLGCVWLTYAVGTLLLGRRAGIFAGFLSAVLPLEVILASELYPDVHSAFFAFWGLYLFLRAEQSSSPRVRLYVLSGLAFGLGFLCKMTAVFIIASVGVLVIRARRWRPAYHACGAAFLAILAVECAVSAALTGNAFFRFTGVSANAEIIGATWYPTTQDLVARMTWEIPAHLFFPLHPQFAFFAFLPWLFIPAAVFGRREPGIRKLLWVAATVLLCIWFWPLSLFPFVPALEIEGRHLLFLVLPMSIVTGAWLSTIRPRRAFSIAGLYLVCALASSGFIQWFLTVYDAGERKAFTFLKEKDARRVALRTGRDLFQYLSGHDPEWDIRHLYVEDLDRLSGFYIVLDERDFVRRSPEDQTRIPVTELEPHLSRWREVFSVEVPVRAGPFRLLRGPALERYRVRVLYRD